MIVAGGTNDGAGRVTVLLGLSEENVRRMAAGEPVVTSLDAFGLSADVLIFGGVGDEDDLHATLAEHFHIEGEDH